MVKGAFTVNTKKARSLQAIEEDIRRSEAPLEAAFRALRHGMSRQEQAGRSAGKVVRFLRKNGPSLLFATGLAWLAASRRRRSGGRQ
jgi:hypothetical protein